MNKERNNALLAVVLIGCLFLTMAEAFSQSAGGACTLAQSGNIFVTAGNPSESLICNGSNWVLADQMVTSGSVGIAWGASAPTPAVALDVNGGVRIGSDSGNCSSSKAGEIMYANGEMQFCNGSLWVALNSGGGSSNCQHIGTGTCQPGTNACVGLSGSPSYSVNTTSTANNTVTVPQNCSAIFKSWGAGGGGGGSMANESGTIAGTVTLSDIVNLTFTSSSISGSPVTVSYTVQSGDTTSTIASGLVTAINSNSALSAASLKGLASGAVVYMSYPSTLSPAPTFSESVGKIETATIAGTVTLSNIVYLTFTSSSISGSPVTVSYTVQSGDTTSTIASGLATAINSNSALSAAFLTGSASGAVVYMSYPSTLSPVPTFSQSVGKVETATISAVSTGKIATIKVTSTGITGSPVTISYTALSSDTASTVATQLATLINSNSALSAVSLTALASSGVVYISYPSTLSPAPTFANTGSTATVTLAAPAVATVTLAAPAVATVTLASYTAYAGGAGGGGGFAIMNVGVEGSDAQFYIYAGSGGAGGNSAATAGGGTGQYNGGNGEPISTTKGGGGGGGAASGVWIGSNASGTLQIVAAGGGGGYGATTSATGATGGAGGASGSGTAATNSGTNASTAGDGGGGGGYTASGGGGAQTFGGANFRGSAGGINLMGIGSTAGAYSDSQSSGGGGAGGAIGSSGSTGSSGKVYWVIY